MEDDSGSYHTLPLSIFPSQERRITDLIFFRYKQRSDKRFKLHKWTAKINSLFNLKLNLINRYLQYNVVRGDWSES